MPELVDRARALHERGVTEQNLGRPGNAARLLEGALRALERAGDSSEAAHLSAEVWISLAYSQVDLRGFEAGLSALEEAQRRAERVGDSELVVRVHSQHAIVAIRSGRYDLAATELTQAHRLLDHADGNTRYAILLNTGLVSLLQHDLPAARRALKQAVEFAREADVPLWIFKALHNLAYLEFLAGDIPAALHGMGEVLQLGGDELPRGIPLLDRARVLAESGLTREADAALTEAAVIFGRDRLTQDLGEVELERARCALVSGDLRRARALARRARTRFDRRGNAQWRRSADLVALQTEVVAGRVTTAVLRSARTLRDEAKAEGLRLVTRHASLLVVQALLARGDLLAAEGELAALGQARPGDPITGRLHDHYVRACWHAASGDPTMASRRARRALGELADYQASFGSIDLRTASAVHGRRLAELDVTVALDSGRPAAVFAAVERARAVSSRMPPVRPPADPVVAELLAELRQNLETLRTVEQDKAASAPLLRARRVLERQITARSWTVAGSGAVAGPAAFAEVRAALAARDAVMVIYVQAGPRLAALVVGRAIRLVELDGSAAVVEQTRRVRADLDLLAQPRLPPALRASVRGSLNRSLAYLDSALLAPLAAQGPLVLVSTGVLGQLPWASLPSLRARPIAVAPSATKWLLSTTGSRAGTTTAVALAGPDLARGQAEAEAVGSAWVTGRVLGPEVATTAALGDAMGTATVLHVAAHGVHQPENPLFSSVRMIDGPVFAHELDQRGSAPEHVVLSACEVGLATVRPGDEALGLASVLLHLGTRSVVAGVARVGDEVAARTMAGYHATLATGVDSSVALAQALSEVDADVVPPFVNFGAAWAAGGDLESAGPLA